MNSLTVEDLAVEAKLEALQQGLMIRTEETPESSELVTYAPFTLFPTAMPKAAYDQALALQTHYNTLVDKVSQDTEFLHEALASTIAVDDFTARLFRIHRHIVKEGTSQPVALGLVRSDYMLDQREDGTSSLKQVEINTIAAGCGGLSSRMPQIHREVLKFAGRPEDGRRIPDSAAAAGLAAGLAKAWELYGSERAVVMFLVDEKPRNVFDQKFIEYELWKRNIPTTRKLFGDVCETGSLDRDKRLHVDGQEVAVVYYRNGYMPEQYNPAEYWDARLLMERSLAVKCPDISTHLAGTKKVQQVLAEPGVLERFFPEEPEVVEQIRATFTGLYTLDLGPEGDRAVAMALAAPERFVLKPQREGGGNNIYGSDICKVLRGMTDGSERTAYILMDKIQAVPSQNFLLRRDSPLKITNCVSELGAFGVYVRRGKDVVMNECVGHLLRTKSSECSEGGLMSGAAGLDNPLLV